MKKSDLTKQKILEAAENAFAEKGFYGARVDEIAEAAEANKRMIYAYFGDKENLYIAVLDTVYQRLAESEEKLLLEETDPVCAVKQLIRHDFEFLSENESFIKIVMWENLNEAKYLNQSNAVSVKKRAIELLSQRLREGIKQGVFRKDLDVEETIFSINMFCFSRFSNIYTMRHMVSMDYNKSEEMEKHCNYITAVILSSIIADDRIEERENPQEFPHLIAFAQSNLNKGSENSAHVADFSERDEMVK